MSANIHNVMDDVLRIAKEQQEIYLRAYQAGHEEGYRAAMAEARRLIAESITELLASKGNQAAAAPPDAVYPAPTPRGSLPNSLGASTDDSCGDAPYGVRS